MFNVVLKPTLPFWNTLKLGLYNVYERKGREREGLRGIWRGKEGWRGRKGQHGGERRKVGEREEGWRGRKRKVGEREEG